MEKFHTFLLGLIALLAIVATILGLWKLLSLFVHPMIAAAIIFLFPSIVPLAYTIGLSSRALLRDLKQRKA